jgi:Mo-co oxidoreductase dimerisation domain/Oxidoreductase FAD-binding domain
MHECYTIKGYANNGRVRGITTAELSLDKGRSWKFAGIVYPEDVYRHLANEIWNYLEGNWICRCEIEFQLERNKQDLGLPIGQYLFIRVNDTNSEWVVRVIPPCQDLVCYSLTSSCA